MSLRAVALTLGGLYVTAYTVKSATVHLDHFAPAEFGVWWPRMSTELLRALDEYRAALGAPLEISPAPGSLGRVLDDDAGSQHNVARWGEVRAADVLIPEGMTLREAYDVAREAGVFSGVGVYPDWTPRPGLHLDVRADRSPDDPALWSGLDDGEGGQRYAALSVAWNRRGPSGVT